MTFLEDNRLCDFSTAVGLESDIQFHFSFLDPLTQIGQRPVLCDTSYFPLFYLPRQSGIECPLLACIRYFSFKAISFCLLICLKNFICLRGLTFILLSDDLYLLTYVVHRLVFHFAVGRFSFDSFLVLARSTQGDVCSCLVFLVMRGGVGTPFVYVDLAFLQGRRVLGGAGHCVHRRRLPPSLADDLAEAQGRHAVPFTSNAVTDRARVLVFHRMAFVDSFRQRRQALNLRRLLVILGLIDRLFKISESLILQRFKLTRVGGQLLSWS